MLTACVFVNSEGIRWQLLFLPEFPFSSLLTCPSWNATWMMTLIQKYTYTNISSIICVSIVWSSGHWPLSGCRWSVTWLNKHHCWVSAVIKPVVKTNQSFDLRVPDREIRTIECQVVWPYRFNKISGRSDWQDMIKWHFCSKSVVMGYVTKPTA